MKRLRLISIALSCLALASGWSATPCFGQGMTPQILTWAGTTETALALDTAYPIHATASSGLPVTLQVEAGPATLAGGSLTVVGVGSVVVSATQAGDAVYMPVRETRSFNVREALVTRAGGLDTSGNAAGVWVAGGVAYVADGTAGLQVVDISDPAAPKRLGGYNTSGTAWAAHVAGGIAYVADGTAGLQVIDVSNPAAPTRLGGYDTSGVASAVQVVGTIAYVADGDAGLQVIDVSNPAFPIFQSRFATISYAGDVKVVGNIAHVLSRSAVQGGLEMVDVTDPANPALVGSFYFEANFFGSLDVVDGFAYVATGDSGLQILDVGDPAAPALAGSFNRFAGVPFAGTTEGVHVVGNIAHLTHRTFAGVTIYNGYSLVDVSDPAHPRQVGGFLAVDTGGATPVPSWTRVRVAGDTAYLARGTSGLEVFSIRMGLPQTLTWPAGLGPILALNTNYPLEVKSTSGLPVALRVVSGPATAAAGLIAATGVGTVQVEAEQLGDSAYLPTRATRAFNVQRAVISRVVNFPSNLSRDVDVAGNFAYLANGGAGLEVVDVGNPANPSRVGGYDTSGSATAVSVAGNTAYVADGEAGLQIIDVGNPSSPSRLGGFNTSGSAGGLHVAGGIAYVADGVAGLQLIDVRNQANPSRLGGYDTSGFAAAVRVSGGFAYVADREAGLQVVNVAVPASPVRVGGYDTSGVASDVDVAGSFAYVADGRGGLQVFDVGNPANPLRVGGAVFTSSSGFPYQVTKVHVVANLAYLCTSFGSPWLVADVSNPSNPILVGSLDTFAASAQVVGGHAYLVGDSLLKIVELKTGNPQEIIWAGTGDEVLALDKPHPLSATASSGLPVTLKVDFGPATLVNGLLKVTGPGLVQVTAEQPGDLGYAPVRQTRSFNLRQVGWSALSLTDLGHNPDQGVFVHLEDVQVSGSLAFLATSDGFRAGLVVMDVSNPASPVLLGGLQLGNDLQTMDLEGDFLYVADGSEGLMVVDVGDPAHPALVGSFAGGILGARVAGRHAYLVGYSGLQVVDVSNPAALTPVGAIGGFAFASVCVAGDFAYLVASPQGLAVIDISDPANPRQVGGNDLIDPAYGLDVAGNYAYLVGNSGLQVIDVANPTNPVRVGSAELEAPASEVQVVGNTAYVVNWRTVVEVFDVTNPRGPARLGRFETGGLVMRVAGDFIYADGVAGFAVGRILPREPQLLRLELPAQLSFSRAPIAGLASSASGLPLAFSIASGPANIVDRQLVLTGVGAVTLRAEHPGDGLHLPAHAEWTFTVLPPTPAVRLAGGQVELSWPSGLENLVLRHRETLAHGQPWRDVTAPRAEVDGEVRVNVETAAASGYFQLVGP